MKEKEILEEAKVLRSGHFELKSKKHSQFYVDLKKFSQEAPKSTFEYCNLLSNKVRHELSDKNIDADVCVGPAFGGVVPAYLIATFMDLKCGFLEKLDGSFTCRTPESIAGKNVIVVEDVATTGGTIQQSIDYVDSIGGKVVAVVILVDRSNGTAVFNVPLISGLEISFPVYDPNECPLCKEGIGLIKPGSVNK